MPIHTFFLFSNSYKGEHLLILQIAKKDALEDKWYNFPTLWNSMFWSAVNQNECSQWEKKNPKLNNQTQTKTQENSNFME